MNSTLHHFRAGHACARYFDGADTAAAPVLDRGAQA